jgi:rhodanese-related sulfurtransferase
MGAAWPGWLRGLTKDITVWLYRHMNPQDAAALLRADAAVRILDVRTVSEFENGHISGAYNVPLDQLHEHAPEIRAASGPVILVCQSGQRAQKAEALLRAAGMSNVRVLAGGMQAWIAAGHQVRRVRARVSLERQVRIVAGAIVAIGSLTALFAWPEAAWIPALIGSGLVFAGVSDTCAMGMLLAKLPYNRGAASCDTESIVRQFLTHPPGSRP